MGPARAYCFRKVVVCGCSVCSPASQSPASNRALRGRSRADLGLDLAASVAGLSLVQSPHLLQLQLTDRWRFCHLLPYFAFQQGILLVWRHSVRGLQSNLNYEPLLALLHSQCLGSTAAFEVH